MVKKFTLMFLLGIFGLFSTNLFAQEDASIDPANIKYWIGDGENEVVFIVNWNEPDTALAWGYRFSEATLTVENVISAIAEEDYRFDYVGPGGWMSEITFNDGVLNLHLVGQWWMYNVNGVTASNYYDAQTVTDGDWIKFGDESCGIITDPVNYYYVWTKEVAPVYALGEEAMIDPSEILYWIGEGENEVVFCVNWNEPNIALAWGFRFDGEYTVETMMNTIENMDHRFSYEATSSVDTRTERHIEHGMDRLMKNRTTFVIAHRLSTVRNANAIMVLEHGEIIERGDHDDLLAQKGRYYELYTGVTELD